MFLSLKNTTFGLLIYAQKRTFLLSKDRFTKSYKYKYNGKEYQDELGLNMYDMDMRQYDPAIGRWIVQDPVVHLSVSPYTAFENNPVIFSDPTGADVSEDEKGTYFTGVDAQNFFRALVASIGSSNDSEDNDDPKAKDRRSGRQRESNGRNAEGTFDSRGEELFSHWISGSGKDLLLNGKNWQDYMRNNEYINSDLMKDAFEIASGMASNSQTSTSKKSGNHHIDIQDGYTTGYEMLHGTNFFSYGVVGEYDSKTDTYTFNFNLKWFDRINPNLNIKTDVKYAKYASYLYSPKDYNVSIRWTQTITVSGSEVRNKNINGAAATKQ